MTPPRGSDGPLADRQPEYTNGRARLVDAVTLADLLGVERAWVYDHAAELGALTLGTGPKPRLRFDPDAVLERIGCWSSSRSRPPVAQAPPSASTSDSDRSARRSPFGAPKRSSAGSILTVRPRRAA